MISSPYSVYSEFGYSVSYFHIKFLLIYIVNYRNNVSIYSCYYLLNLNIVIVFVRISNYWILKNAYKLMNLINYKHLR